MDSRKSNKFKTPKAILQNGFTLIELLVIISIIGMIASVIFVSVKNANAKARDSKRLEDLRLANLGLQLFHDEAGGYPQKNDWDKSARDGEMLKCGSTNIFLIPKDPLTKLPYNYTNSTAGHASTQCPGHGQVWDSYKIEFETEHPSAFGPAGTYYSSPSGFSSTAPF